MTHSTTELHKEIRYDRATRDYAMRYEGELIGFAPTYSQAEITLNQYVFDLLTHGGCETAAALDGGQAEAPTCPPMVIPNDGLHLTQYTVVTSRPGETFTSVVKTLCDGCRAKTPGASKMGEVINGFCDGCGIGPSVSHFRLVVIDPPNPICAACHTDAHPASAMQPAFCCECVDAMLHGRDNRLSADDVPTENPDVDTTPETAGPSPLRRPRCACGSIATIWDEGHFCAAHYLELPAPQLFCPSCLCVAEQTDIEHTPDAWRCRNPTCLSVARLDDLLTLSQLIERRAALDRIKMAVFARLACRNCGGPHRIQACPEIAQALLAAEATPVEYDTLEMVRLWSMSRALLVAKLARLTRPQLLAQAVAFAAWLETRTHAGLKAASVLHIWEQMIEVDNGPAAPAMMRAA